MPDSAPLLIDCGVAVSAGDSTDLFEPTKVADRNGKPLTVYHGTDKRFGKFLPKGDSHYGIYASVDPRYAAEYGTQVRRLHVDIKRPFVIDLVEQGDPRTETSASASQGEIVINGMIIGFYRHLNPEDIETLKANGYDGITVSWRGVPNFEVVAFDSDQVREAPTPAPSAPIAFKENMRDAYKGQKNLSLTAVIGEDVAGWVDYTEHEGKPAVSFMRSIIQRAGVATAMAQKLQSEYPGVEINWGGFTSDGEAFMKSLPREFIPNHRHEAASTELRLITERIAVIKTSPVNSTPELSDHDCDALNSLFDRQSLLEHELEGIDHGKWIVCPAPITAEPSHAVNPNLDDRNAAILTAIQLAIDQRCDVTTNR